MSQKTSWKDQIKQKWDPHAHCSICGKAVQPDKKFCSQACRDKYLGYEMKQKKKGRIQLVFLLGLMLFMFIMIFFMF